MSLQCYMSTIPFLLLLISYVNSQPDIFDVTKEGAIGDGKTESTKALLISWQKACERGGSVVVPKGTYLMGEVKFAGPCKGPMIFAVEGTIVAPADPGAIKGFAWVSFEHVDRLTISGGGTFDGQGHVAWAQKSCVNKGICTGYNLAFNAVSNSQVQYITSRNSKNFHVVVLDCTNLTFKKLTSTAPATSPNTDGLHIARSQLIHVTESTFSTGDDCISIGDGSRQINITGVTCGPGHGISVGSLGFYPNEQPVSGIYVQHSTLLNTKNGLRIKTWPAKNAGSASNMHFRNVNMENVQNPVIIDQEYCPDGECNTKGPSEVKISDVSFEDITGTSATPVAVEIKCSSMFPCAGVRLGNIELKYNGGVSKSQCSNVHPIITGSIPPGC